MRSLVATLSILSLVGSVYAETPLIIGSEATLYVEDMQKTLATLPPEAPQQLAGAPEKLRKMIDQTYMAKVAAQRARNANRQNDPDYQAILWNFENNNLALMEANAYVNAHMPSDVEVKKAAHERYLTDPERYKTEDSVEAAHILFAVSSEAEDAVVLERAKEVRANLLENKISFSDAAKQYSSDKGSAEHGGKVGRFGKGKMVKPFEDVVFAMQNAGDISQPVRTKFGYHLILLENKTEGHLLPFDQVKGKIMEDVKKEIALRIREDYWLAIRDDNTVKIDEAELQKFMKNPTSVTTN